MLRSARSIQPGSARRFVVAALMAAAFVGCATPPDLDLSLRHPSAQGRFVVELQPPAATPAINQIHRWQIKLNAADGRPVRQARIAVDGGMPQHGHGLPTRPQVTAEGADGTYTLDGMKFSMTGWWQIRLAIESAEGADSAVFNTVVAAPGAAR
jgi:hypothetical protein